jgi:hypothetical protein
MAWFGRAFFRSNRPHLDKSALMQERAREKSSAARGGAGPPESHACIFWSAWGRTPREKQVGRENIDGDHTEEPTPALTPRHDCRIREVTPVCETRDQRNQAGASRMSGAPESDRLHITRAESRGRTSGSDARAGEGASDDVHARDVRECVRQERVVARPRRSGQNEQVRCSD